MLDPDANIESEMLELKPRIKINMELLCDLFAYSLAIGVPWAIGIWWLIGAVLDKL